MAKLDPFHIMIVSQHFSNISDFKNLERVHQKYRGNMLKFHFNPIPLTPEILPFFPNIETLNVWSLPAQFFNFYDIVKDSLPQKYFQEKKNTQQNYKSSKYNFYHLNIWYEVSYSCSLITANGRISYKNVCLHKDERKGCGNKIPQNVRSLGYECFVCDRTLSEIEIPNSVTRLGHRCFFLCINLAKVVLPKTLKEIQVLCFSGCKSLKEIEIPETVETIGWNAFSGCEIISKVEIPGSVKELKGWTFGGCVSLKEVVLNEGIEEIEKMAFINCDLKTVVIPRSVTYLENSAFDGNVMMLKN
ncbi:hypothetical protein EIN_039600 [Entamoeba invadens IP1]|uniref:Leucine rich repeat containing protein BspA family protein n=1 Tax=Entamoeba invadens IP1 TaxID=370355 RepID=A0A0A1U1S8_ENTIV|nr:hypothetical protein EIN_039600 [Entamoeba invadens IP1]ELP85476.1 hypothetical protein EIN_039600 [Entamoeba invadens IP1]|eukprot:XP_004184822.1 hypothetical protein EIN_039600 [Entamoeba invadens IP1]